MKATLSYLLLMILTISCQMKPTETATKASTEDAYEETTENTSQATAIFWIDKAEVKHCKEYGFRTIKAHVYIHEDGTVDLQGFAKHQSNEVEKYIRHHLAKFQVSSRMLKEGYVQPGEQFVQLRCLMEKLKGK